MVIFVNKAWRVFCVFYGFNFTVGVVCLSLSTVPSDVARPPPITPFQRQGTADQHYETIP